MIKMKYKKMDAMNVFMNAKKFVQVVYMDIVKNATL